MNCWETGSSYVGKHKMRKHKVNKRTVTPFSYGEKSLDSDVYGIVTVDLNR